MTLLSGPSDPLGLIAAQAKTYVGEFVDDLADITDDERRHYLSEMQKTALAMPLEAVMLNFSISGVTRGFTHQMVRQRTAAYAQESTRFSVIEDGFVDRVSLPPSLLSGKPIAYWEAEAEAEVARSGVHFVLDTDRDEKINLVRESLVEHYGDVADKARFAWEKALQVSEEAYKQLVNSGIPAEDARGLLPTNITTRIKYNTNLRSLLEHIGLRTCTQAQFEWRGVAFQMMKALQRYGQKQRYWTTFGTIRSGSVQPLDEEGKPFGTPLDMSGATARAEHSSQWQYEAIAGLFAPICYRAGKCTMKASFDRKCSIRDRVEQNAKIGRPSSEWHKPRDIFTGHDTYIEPIRPSEWMLDPGAAR